MVSQDSFLAQPCLERLHDLTLKGGREHPLRIQVFPPLTDIFELLLKIKSDGRHNAVNMRVKAQVLSPGMKHADGTALHPIMAVAKDTEGFPHAPEQSQIKATTIQQADIVEHLRNSKHHM